MDAGTGRSLSYNFRSEQLLQEHFLTGGTSSGAIGALGLVAGNGTTSYVASATNRQGILRRDTGAVSATVASLQMGSNAGQIDTALYHRIIWTVRANQTDANTTIRLGAMNSPVASPPTHGIYFERLDADTNWFCVTRSSGSETRADSGVAITTNFARFMYVRSTGKVQFYIADVLVAEMTLTIPSAFTLPSTHIVNSAAASKTLDHNYFQFYTTGLVA